MSDDLDDLPVGSNLRHLLVSEVEEIVREHFVDEPRLDDNHWHTFIHERIVNDPDVWDGDVMTYAEDVLDDKPDCSADTPRGWLNDAIVQRIQNHARATLRDLREETGMPDILDVRYSGPLHRCTSPSCEAFWCVTPRVPEDVETDARPENATGWCPECGDWTTLDIDDEAEGSVEGDP